MKQLVVAGFFLLLLTSPLSALDVDTYRSSQKQFNIEDKAEQGDAQAQFELGLQYEKGDGVNKDLKKAIYWYQKAADQGQAEAQNNLGVLYLKGEGVPQNSQQAMHWFKKASEQGLAIGQNNIGILYENGLGVKKDSGPGFYLVSKGCRRRKFRRTI